jgi:hypothetical protein
MTGSTLFNDEMELIETRTQNENIIDHIMWPYQIIGSTLL